jgi:PAS domain S-box-containing protein
LELLELHIREMPIPVILFDRDVRIESWNPAAERVFGFSAREAVGRFGVDLLVAPDKQSSVRGVLRPVVDQARPNDNLNENITKDGRTIICEWINRPILGPDGEVERLLSIAQDVTERFRAEHEAAVASAMLRAEFELSPDGMLVLNERHERLSYNRRYLELGGMTDDFLTASDTEGVRRHLATLTQDPQSYLDRIAEIDANPEQSSYDAIRTNEGRTIERHSAPLRLEVGEVRGRVWFFRDITEGLKSAEDKSLLAAIVRSSTDAIVSVNLDGVVTSWNPGAERILGYTSEEMIGRPFRLADADGHYGSAFEEITGLIRSGPEAQSLELSRRRKDGALIDLSIVLSAMKSADGEVIGGSLIGRDVTERNRARARREEAESALRDLRSELARIGRLSMLGEFAATIAHEVNQPLAAIAANSAAASHWLSAQPANLDEARTALSRIDQDSYRANEVIKRTRAMVVRGGPDYADIDLNHLIREIVLMTRSEQEKSRASVVETLLDDLPPVRGNRIELQQVVLNLLLNALEAMRGITGHDHVLVIRTNRQGPGMARVTVRDTGAGFDTETADRLFEHSTRPRSAARAWASAFRAPSWRRMAAACGGRRRLPRARFSASLSRSPTADHPVSQTGHEERRIGWVLRLNRLATRD